jgi:hypothetical protein
MGSAIYKILPYEGGWGVEHDGSTTGPYATKEAALAATADAAGIAIRDGHAIEISAPGRDADRPAPMQGGR